MFSLESFTLLVWGMDVEEKTYRDMVEELAYGLEADGMNDKQVIEKCLKNSRGMAF